MNLLSYACTLTRELARAVKRSSYVHKLRAYSYGSSSLTKFRVMIAETSSYSNVLIIAGRLVEHI